MPAGPFARPAVWSAYAAAALACFAASARLEGELIADIHLGVDVAAFGLVVAAAAAAAGHALRRSVWQLLAVGAGAGAVACAAIVVIDLHARAGLDVDTAHFDVQPVAGGLRYAYGLSVADFDADGVPDVSISDSWVDGRSGPAAARIYMAWAGRRPSLIVSRETFEGMPAPQRPKFLIERQIAVDLWGHGLPDIVGVANSHSGVVAYRNPGRRGTEWAREALSMATPGAVNLVAADIDQDGHVDIVVALRNQMDSRPVRGRGIVWLRNPGRDGSAWELHPIDVSDTFDDVRTLLATDIDGDGRVDIVASDTTSGGLYWFANLGPRGWTRHPIDGLDMRTAHYGALADVDGDGVADLVLPHRHGVSWLERRDGGHRWIEHRIHYRPNHLPYGYDSKNFITEVAAGDFDGDGAIDVAFAIARLSARRSGQVFVALRRGAGWSVVPAPAVAGRAVGLATFQPERSGRPSLLATVDTGSVVRLGLP